MKLEFFNKSRMFCVDLRKVQSWEGARGQQRSALRPFLTSALALRPFLTSPLSAQTLSFRSALHPFAISAQRSYLILDRRSALKTFISFQRSALKAIFQNRSALKDPLAPLILHVGPTNLVFSEIRLIEQHYIKNHLF